MLPTLIQRYDKNHFIFDQVQKRKANWIFTGCQMPHFMIKLIPYINLLNLSLIKIMSIFEEYGAFKDIHHIPLLCVIIQYIMTVDWKVLLVFSTTFSVTVDWWDHL